MNVSLQLSPSNQVEFNTCIDKIIEGQSIQPSVVPDVSLFIAVTVSALVTLRNLYFIYVPVDTYDLLFPTGRFLLLLPNYEIHFSVTLLLPIRKFPVADCFNASLRQLKPVLFHYHFFTTDLRTLLLDLCITTFYYSTKFNNHLLHNGML